MKKRNLGAMRHRIRLKNKVRNPDGAGGFERADTAGDTIQAAIETLSAREVTRYQQLQKNVTHRLTVRHRSDLKHGQTVTWLRGTNDEVDFYVEATSDPRPNRPGEWLELICREGGNQ